jgi:hypothetical protein
MSKVMSSSGALAAIRLWRFNTGPEIHRLSALF